MNNFLTTIFGASWRTSLIGLMTAIIVVVKPLIATGKINWEQIGIAILIVVFAFVTKDKNVTGGTIAATPEADKRIEKEKEKE